MGKQDNSQFAEFLRSRRRRLKPSDVGIPDGEHRRSKGLRREEVATLAGISVTWYTRLEQGNRVRPSPSAVRSIAEVLKLSSAERHHLHLLAYGRPPVPVEDQRGLDAVERTMSVMTDVEHPVFSVNWLGGVTGWNPAAATWYTDFGAIPMPRRNMLLWTLTHPAARRRIAEWDWEVRDMVARFRGATAARVGDPLYDKFIEDLQESSPEFKKWWKEYEVLGHRDRPRTLVHPELGTRTYSLVEFNPMGQDCAAMIMHSPVDVVPNGAEGVSDSDTSRATTPVGAGSTSA